MLGIEINTDGCVLEGAAAEAKDPAGLGPGDGKEGEEVAQRPRHRHQDAPGQVPSLDITLYCGLQRGGEDAERPGEGVLVVVGTAVTRAAAVLLQAGVAGLVTGVQPRVQPRHGHIGQQLSARPRHGTDTDTGSSLPARVFILASRRAPLPQYCDSHWPGEIESV